MCNEHKHTEDTQEYRFIDYRLDQLELNLRKGQEKLEQDQQRNYKELIQMLQVMQEANNEQNKQINSLKEEINLLNSIIEEKDKTIDFFKGGN